MGNEVLKHTSLMDKKAENIDVSNLTTGIRCIGWPVL